MEFYYKIKRKIKDIIEDFIARCQRFIRGYADKDTWDIDDYVINTFLPILKQFKRQNDGAPYPLTTEEWDNIIQEMIDCLEIMKEDNHILGTGEEFKKADERFYELFTKWHNDLWW